MYCEDGNKALLKEGRESRERSKIKGSKFKTVSEMKKEKEYQKNRIIRSAYKKRKNKYEKFKEALNLIRKPRICKQRRNIKKMKAIEVFNIIKDYYDIKTDIEFAAFLNIARKTIWSYRREERRLPFIYNIMADKIRLITKSNT